MTIEELKQNLKWWESKRWIFNVFVGLCGLFGIINGLNSWIGSSFEFIEVFGIIFWGLFANLLYSLGEVVELLDFYYFNNRLNLKALRLIFLILGTALYCLVTYMFAWNHYSNFFLW